MIELKKLIISEVVDFYAGFESPGEPETVEEAQSQLIARIKKIFALTPEQKPLAYYSAEMPMVLEQRGYASISATRAGGCQYPLYIAPAQPVIPEQQTVQLAPHVHRELVNNLRDTAVMYAGAGQLREQLNRTLSNVITAAHSHLAQPVSEPYKLADGWKLVPIEPTPKMLVAAMGVFTAEELAEAWGDMISAAPAQESE